MTQRTLHLLLLIFTLGAPSVLADEQLEVYREMQPLKKEYREMISKIRRAGNDELKAESMKSMKAIGAVGKAIENHPDLAEQRKARDEAKAAYLAARKSGDEELIKKTRRVSQDASGALTRDGFKLKEVQDLQAASVAQRKKVEALNDRLVAESGEEGKTLIEKLRALEARYDALREKK